MSFLSSFCRWGNSGPASDTHKAPGHDSKRELLLQSCASGTSVASLTLNCPALGMPGPPSPGHTTKLDTGMRESTGCWGGKKCTNSLHNLPAADFHVSETHATSVKNHDNIYWRYRLLMTEIENMLVTRPGPQGVHSKYYSLLFLTQ